MNIRKAAAVLLAVMCLVCCFSSCGEQGINYGEPSNWACYQLGEECRADLFFVCPTVDMGRDGNMNVSVSNTKTRERFVGALNQERGIYEDTLTLYAPYYRQATFPVYSMESDEAEKYLGIAYSDVRSAFMAFTENRPEDRPFVLAGFSQGADMVLRLLKEFFSEPSLREQLIAAYCIGWRITDADLSGCPWIVPAKGADDTGVVICFSSEAEEITDSMIVPAGVKSYSINPLNWRTDSVYAPASENKGACFTDYTGEITLETPGLTGAYIDETRGTLKAPDIRAEDYSNSVFPSGIYHLNDFQFFYRNLQENVEIRTEAYFTLNPGSAEQP